MNGKCLTCEYKACGRGCQFFSCLGCKHVSECVNDLRRYMAECIKKLNKGVRINLRNAILRRLEFLEWRYGE